MQGMFFIANWDRKGRAPMDAGLGCIRKVDELRLPVSNISLCSLPQFLLAGFCLKLLLWLPSMMFCGVKAEAKQILSCFTLLFGWCVQSATQKETRTPVQEWSNFPVILSSIWSLCLLKETANKQTIRRLDIQWLISSTLGDGIWGPELSGECGNLPRLQAAELTVASRSPW